MKVKDIMTARSLKCCSLDTTLIEITKIMKESNCGALPVVDKDKKVLGIITDRDICLSMAKKNIDSFSDLTVGHIMKSKIHTVHIDDDIATVFRLMRINQIGRLPVVDKKGILKGIVSLHNIINKLISNGNNELVDLSYSGENLIKTIQAVSNRNELKKSRTLKKSKEIDLK